MQYVLLTHTLHVMPSNVTAATCGPPVSSQNGFIIPHSNNLEGAIVTYVCWTVHETRHHCMCNEMNATAVCNDDGNWEPNAEDICMLTSESSDHESGWCQYKLIISIRFRNNYADTGNGLNQDGKVIMISSIVSVVSSSIFFIFGFLCGHFYRKGSIVHAHESVPVQPPSLEGRHSHDNIMVHLNRHKQEDFELETNAAYGSVPQ